MNEESQYSIHKTDFHAYKYDEKNSKKASTKKDKLYVEPFNSQGVSPATNVTQGKEKVTA